MLLQVELVEKGVLHGERMRRRTRAVLLTQGARGTCLEASSVLSTVVPWIRFREVYGPELKWTS
jgi:hypothetical protein